MSSTTEVSLVEQRQRLCRQLQAQRQLIARRLGPEPEASGRYPRSFTMRLLSFQPALLMRLLVGLATQLRMR
jgi:hypothetical protein